MVWTCGAQILNEGTMSRNRNLAMIMLHATWDLTPVTVTITGRNHQTSNCKQGLTKTKMFCIELLKNNDKQCLNQIKSGRICGDT